MAYTNDGILIGIGVYMVVTTFIGFIIGLWTISDDIKLNKILTSNNSYGKSRMSIVFWAAALGFLIVPTIGLNWLLLLF